MTSASFSVKTLKERFEDGDLDLSLSTLSEQNVPLKEMKQLKKIQSLDLSCNILQALPMELCTFTSLIKLDVSKNQLASLPANIGQLSNLQSLDLLGNQLTTLPESFGDLTSLRWLDVRDNPLSAAILKEAGDCLDDKQCKTCALRVVKLMNYVHVEREKIRVAEETKKQEEAARLAEEARQEKKRLKLEEKERKRQQFLQRQQQAGESGKTVQDSGEDTRKSETIKEKTPAKTDQSGGSSIICDIISSFIWLFMLSAVFAAAIVVIYYHCESVDSKANASSLCHSSLWQPVKSFIKKSIMPFAQNVQEKMDSLLSAPKSAS